MSDIDYRAVDLPDDKDPEDYSYIERRAQILVAVERVGSPRRLNGAELGRRYGVTRETIRRDLERLGEYVDESIGSDTHTLEASSFLWRCCQELMDEGEWRQAARTYKDLEEWRRNESLEELVERIEKLEEELHGAGGLDTSRFRIK